MDNESKKIITKVIIDCLCLAAVGLPCLMLNMFGVPYQRGFFCDDTSIKYPYKDSTVSNVLLYIVGLGVPISAMVAGETLSAQRYRNTQTPIFIWGNRLPLWLLNTYKTVGVFCFGALCSQLVTDIGKYTIGRLRPHFFSICQPSYNCTLAHNQHEYILPVSFTCLGGPPKRLKDARLSFPSGHSSFSAYTMVYLAIYIQVKLRWRGSYLFRRVLQMCCIALAWITALSRVSDYKHHWSDVLVGLFIGTTSAFLTALYVSNLYDTKRFSIQQAGAVSSASNQAMVDKHDHLDKVNQQPVEFKQ